MRVAHSQHGKNRAPGWDADATAYLLSTLGLCFLFLSR
jgi:hypothetical protein